MNLATATFVYLGMTITMLQAIIASLAAFLLAAQVAVKVNNGECCFTYFNLLVERVSARFLPSTP